MVLKNWFCKVNLLSRHCLRKRINILRRLAQKLSSVYRPVYNSRSLSCQRSVFKDNILFYLLSAYMRKSGSWRHHTHLILSLMVELVGQPGEVVSNLLAHGDRDLLAGLLPSPLHTHDQDHDHH
jgi:hypothetical protein